MHDSLTYVINEFQSRQLHPLQHGTQQEAVVAVAPVAPIRMQLRQGSQCTLYHRIAMFKKKQKIQNINYKWLMFDFEVLVIFGFLSCISLWFCCLLVWLFQCGCICLWCSLFCLFLCVCFCFFVFLYGLSIIF